MNDPIYRGMDRAALDAAYNNRDAVADYAAIAADRHARSEQLRAFGDLAEPR